MKIHFEHKSTVFELERKPMPEDHFRAVCKLAGGTVGGLVLLGLVRMVGTCGIGWAVGALVLVGIYRIVPKFDD